MSDSSKPADDQHWVRTLYERYAQLYGDPIEQPNTPKTAKEQPDEDKPGHPNQ